MQEPAWRRSRSRRRTSPEDRAAPLTARFGVQLAKTAPPTRPYWHRDSIEETLYQVDRPEFHTMPLPPPPVWGRVKVSVLGEVIELEEPAQVTLDDPRQGFVRQPLSIVPALSVGFSSERGIVPLGKSEYKLSVAVHSNQKETQGSLALRLPEGWRSAPESRAFSFQRENEEASFDFLLSVPKGLGTEPQLLEAFATVDGREYNEGYTPIGARDLGRFNLYRTAHHLVRAVDVKAPEGLRVGYIMGSGDEVPRALELLGARPEVLGPAELDAADLGGFDAVIVGVRAYAVRADLKTFNARLLEYVKAGGVLIVQYQTPEFDQNYGPYPYSMTQNPEEVSEEDSQVEILEPENPLFTSPNKITVKDFEGWVEERGSKFWKSWDDRYRPLLETHDKGQEPQRGGMLFARYGKGAYLYTAYAWYRQLPQGVSGAFRIYANMISLRRTLEGGG